MIAQLSIWDVSEPGKTAPEPTPRRTPRAPRESGLGSLTFLGEPWEMPAVVSRARGQMLRDDEPIPF